MGKKYAFAKSVGFVPATRKKPIEER